MGLVASQARKLFLVSRQSDLEFGMQKISQQRMNLSSQMMSIFNAQAGGVSSTCSSTTTGMTMSTGSALGQSIGSVFDEGSTGSVVGGIVGGICGMFSKNKSSNSGYSEDQQEALLSGLQEKDKCLEMQLETLQTEHDATSTEYDSVKKIIEENIKRSFKYVG